MPSSFERFEALARATAKLPKPAPIPAEAAPSLHPFEERNIHEKLPKKVRTLFDDGHYAESTFNAFKFVDKTVEKLAHSSQSGYKLMMDVFDKANPKLKLTPLTTTSEKDEQEGYRFIFAGSVWAIRNPRGHEFDLEDDPDTCLDHLSFASMLLRRLEQAGFKF